MKIIFDLDGTLLDSRIRLFKLFRDLVPTSSLSFDEYWCLKRNKVSNVMILKEAYFYSDRKIEDFELRWMERVETKKYLKEDILYFGVDKMLEKIHFSNELYLCTARQSKCLAEEQLDSLKIKDYFKKILVTEQGTTKSILLKENVDILNSSDWIIGDTGHDILTGKALGLRTCAVSNGFLSSSVLLDYSPDLILKSAAKINNNLLESSNDAETTK
ncbi:HAD family hydrolase [Shewanella algae]|uniref:HAD family hydrolase n=1 Tax=Shewanella algae TaxID=38313 RepID=UPI003C492E3B